MTTGVIRKSDFRDESETIAILLCCLLFKLGGSITMTLGEIYNIFAEFPEVRLVLQRKDKTGLDLKPEHELLTVLLRSREAVQEDIAKGLG